MGRTSKRWTSRTDPDASLVTRKGWLKPILAHKVHIAVDGGKARIVTAVETTPGGVAESQVLATLLSKHIFVTHCRPEEAVADRAYGTKNLRRERIKAGFRYDSERDIYICPQGKTLYQTKEQADGSVVYKVHRLACKGCPHHGTLL